ncbi:MAG: ABC1 kinase family protein, partial [Bacteroidota bacterium]
MTLSLKPDHLKRYRDIGLLLLRYVDSDLIKTASLDEALLLETESDLPADSEKAKRFAADLEKMGPSFIKLGQLLSTRPDLLPEHYVRALSRLQDDVEPFELAAVNATIESELGPRISKAFSDFDDEPIAAASLAQVHRATLRDGRPVAVKVQRPGIRQQILTDFNALQEVVDILARRTDIGRRFAVDELLKELRSALLRELDFRLEGQNLRRLKENLASYHTIVLPDPIDDYTTSRVLTMEFIEGSPVMSVGPLQMLEIDGERLAADLVRAYLDQILSHGFFHADPHPGNVLVTPDGRIGLLDLGMVAHLGPNDR